MRWCSRLYVHGSADNIQQAVVQLTKLVTHLSADKLKKDKGLEALLDRAESGSTGESSIFIQKQSCSPPFAAADFEDRPEVDLPDVGAEVRGGLAGCLKPARILSRHSHCPSLVRTPIEVQSYPAAIRSGWAIAGIWDLGLLDGEQGGGSSCSSRFGSSTPRPTKLRPRQLPDGGRGLFRESTSIFVFSSSPTSGSMGSSSFTSSRTTLGRTLHAQAQRGLGLPREASEAHPAEKIKGDRQSQQERQGEEWQKRSSTGSRRSREERSAFVKSVTANYEPRPAVGHSSGLGTADEEVKYKVVGASAPQCNVLKLWNSMLRPFLGPNTVFAEFVHFFRRKLVGGDSPFHLAYALALPGPTISGARGEGLSFRRSCQHKAVNFVVLALNWLHLKRPWRAPTTMRRPLTSRQWRTVRRLEKFVVELGAEPTVGPSQMGRTARLGCSFAGFACFGFGCGMQLKCNGVFEKS